MRRSALVTCLLLLGMLVSRASRAGDARTSAAIWQSLNGEADLVALSRAMLRYLRDLHMRRVDPRPAGVDVHEVRRRVVADAAALDVQRRIAERGERDVCQADVDGLSLHLQRAGSHPFRVLAQHVVRLRRAVTRDDLERLRRAGELRQGMQEVEQSGIGRVHVARAEIAQEVVHRRERVGQVAAAAGILDGAPFARVGVGEVEGSCGQCRSRRDRVVLIAWWNCMTNECRRTSSCRSMMPGSDACAAVNPATTRGSSRRLGIE